MNRIFKWIAPMLVGVLLFSSCSEEDKTENLKHSTGYNMMSSIDHLAVVGSIDILGLIEKSGFESNPHLSPEISGAYKLMVKDKLDADKTGIDLSGNNHFAVSMITPDEPEYVMFTAKITNPENAKSTIQDLLKGEYSTEDVDGDKYEFVEEDEVVVAWDDKDLVIVFSEDNDAKKIAKDLLQARYTDGSDDDKGMEAYLEQKDDMSAYVRVANSVDFIEATGTEIPEEFLGAMENAYYVGAGNFNEGNIEFEWNIYAEELQNSEYNALAADAIHESFMNYITNDKLIGFATASVNMGAVFNALEFAQNKDFSFDEVTAVTGLTMEDMEQMFTGEFAVSFVDVISDEVVVESDPEDFLMESYTYNSEIPLVVFTAGIGDSTQFGELFRMSGQAKIVNGVYILDEDAFVALHEDKLILTTHQPTAEYFATGESFKTFNLPANANGGTPIFGFLNTDLSSLPNGMLKMAENEEGQMALEFMGLFESVQFNGEFELMKFKAEMNNKSENSLKVITDFVLKMVKDNQMI